MSPTVQSNKRANSTSPHVPQLDGFRGLAVLLVIIGHALAFRPLSARATQIGDALAPLGVFLFFVLSGYLITTLLYRERTRTGKISFRRFYTRRILRLGPALALFISAVVLLMHFHLITDVPRYEVLAAIFYARNIFGKSQTLGHLWSLSLEEQFYLFWPITFSLLPLKRALATTLTFIGLMIVWRGCAIHWGLFDYTRGIYYTRPYFRFDSILSGGCLALWLSQSGNGPNWASLLSKRLPAALLWLLLLVWCVVGESISRSLFITIQMILIVILLGQLVLGGSARSQWLFCQPSLRYLGRISYSLYLWQQLFLITDEPKWGFLRQFPADALLPIALAMISFHLVEAPILRIKDRLH